MERTILTIFSYPFYYFSMLNQSSGDGETYLTGFPSSSSVTFAVPKEPLSIQSPGVTLKDHSFFSPSLRSR